MATNNKKIGELLIEEGIISEDVTKKVLAEQKQNRIRFGVLLVNSRLASENDIARALSRQYKLEYVDVTRLSVMPEALLLIPEDMARRYLILPCRIEKKTLIAVTSDPLNIEILKEIEFYSGMKVHTVLGTKGAILEAIKYHYRFYESAGHISDVSPSLVKVTEARKEDISVPVIKLVNMLLSEAAESRASDIHIEPAKDFTAVRFRIDGVLVERTRLHPWVHSPLTSRLKILARLNIAEKRLPQDGGFRIRLGEKDIDLRVSTLPVSDNNLTGGFGSVRKGLLPHADPYSKKKGDYPCYRPYRER
jgi:type IV pilus assembly protein PilB